MGLAQNEMKAKPALPERVRSMEGLGVCFEARTDGMPEEALHLTCAFTNQTPE